MRLLPWFCVLARLFNEKLLWVLKNASVGSENASVDSENASVGSKWCYG